MKILLDTCVIIDVLQMRKPYYNHSKKVFYDAALNKNEFYISANSLTDIYYLMRKYIKDEQKTRDTISRLLNFFSVIDIKDQDIVQALNIDGRDFEDDVLIKSAERNEIDMLLTRNKKDFCSEIVKVLSPKEYGDEFHKDNKE